MPAYGVAALNVQESWVEGYVGPVEALVAKHGGRYLARAFEFDQVEGGSRPDVVVILEFPTLDATHAFYDDPEYQPHLQKRLAGCTGDFFFAAET